jgi:hypothetical protein
MSRDRNGVATTVKNGSGGTRRAAREARLT